MIGSSSARSKNDIVNLIIKGKHFCIVPWVHFHITGIGNMSPCCHIIEQGDSLGYGSLNDKTFDELWQGDIIRNFRLKMLKDEKYPLCITCYALEEAGYIYSLRRTFNMKFFLYKNWVLNTDENGFAPDAKPVSWDLRFSNLCNLRCRTCGSHSSSSWVREEKELNLLNDDINNSVIRGIRDSDKLLSDIDKYFPKVVSVYFAGGEPLLSKEDFYILERLDALRKYDIEIVYNTNFTQLRYNNYNIMSLWRKFNNLTILISLDGSGKRGEYIRKGLVWDNIIKNFAAIRDECPNVNLKINSTVSIFNILHLPDFHHEMVEKNLFRVDEFRLNLLHTPKHYNIKILPKKLKEQAAEKIEKHVQWVKEQELYKNIKDSPLIDQWNMCKNYLISEDWSHQIPNLQQITSRLDKMRNELFVDVFPELNPLFNYDTNNC